MRKFKISLAEFAPEVATQWHPTKNGDLTPDKVSAKLADKVWWIVPYDVPKTEKSFDFEWPASIYERAVNKAGCSDLRGANG